jgi:hypothetical protein
VQAQRNDWLNHAGRVVVLSFPSSPPCCAPGSTPKYKLPKTLKLAVIRSGALYRRSKTYARNQPIRHSNETFP